MLELRLDRARSGLVSSGTPPHRVVTSAGTSAPSRNGRSSLSPARRLEKLTNDRRGRAHIRNLGRAVIAPPLLPRSNARRERLRTTSGAPASRPGKAVKLASGYSQSAEARRAREAPASGLHQVERPRMAQVMKILRRPGAMTSPSGSAGVGGGRRSPPWVAAPERRPPERRTTPATTRADRSSDVAQRQARASTSEQHHQATRSF